MIQMIELNYYKFSSAGRHLRRQLLEVSDGWTLSNAVVVGDGSPESLRGFEGGWHFSGKIFRTRKEAERSLAQNRWAPEGTLPPAPEAEAKRNRPRSARRATGRLDIELTLEQRAAIDEEAHRTGASLTATVAKWADSLAKKHTKEKV